MITNELIKNSVNDLKEVLIDIESKKEQKSYKQSVSYVHIPEELIEQLSDQIRMLNECTWYSKLYSDDERKLIQSFYNLVNDELKGFNNVLPDVPEIFGTKEWQIIMNEGSILYNKLRTKINQLLETYDT